MAEGTLRGADRRSDRNKGRHRYGDERPRESRSRREREETQEHQTWTAPVWPEEEDATFMQSAVSALTSPPSKDATIVVGRYQRRQFSSRRTEHQSDRGSAHENTKVADLPDLEDGPRSQAYQEWKDKHLKEEPSSTRPSPPSTPAWSLPPTPAFDEIDMTEQLEHAAKSHTADNQQPPAHVITEIQQPRRSMAPTPEPQTSDAVPTWVGPISHPLHKWRSYTNEPVNSVAVAQPRQWGSPRPTTVTLPAEAGAVAGEEADMKPQTTRSSRASASPAPEKDSWNTSEYLQQWVSNVTVDLNTEHSHSDYATDGASIDLPSRPDSSKLQLPPIKVYYTGSTDTEPSPPMPAVHLSTEERNTGTLSPDLSYEEQASHSEHHDDDSEYLSYGSSDHANNDAQSPWGYPEDQTGGRLVRDYDANSDRADADISNPYIQQPRYMPPSPRLRDRGVWGWWKRNPHPLWSPSFASRRLLVTCAFPIRTDALWTLLTDHFSRYGPIRCVLPVEKNAPNNDKAWVVFHHDVDVPKVFNDPQATTATFRSISRSTTSQIELSIRQPSATQQTRSLWIKFTGPRADARARSASPPGTPALADDGWEKEAFDTRTMPPMLQAWAMPEHLASNRETYRVYLKLPPTNGEQPPVEVVADEEEQTEEEKAQMHEQLYPGQVCIKEINLGRRCSEKEILETMADIFMEVYCISPPSAKTSGGWIVMGSGPTELRQFQHQLFRVPGISARPAMVHEWLSADPEQSDVGDEEPDAALATRRTSDSGTSSSLSHHPAESPHQPPTDRQSQLPVAIGSDSSSPVQSNPQQLNPYSQSAALQQFQIVSNYGYPTLIRQVVLTYQGRRLREEIADGTIRYIDDAGIFIGGLVREQETDLSLLKRFEQYGKIASVKFNPSLPTATYTTARVLFHDANAAQRAITNENGAESFGSAIKVELRRVLPHDVQAREMFVDDRGRAISPTMVGQYTPPYDTEPPSMPLPPPAVSPTWPSYNIQAPQATTSWPQPQTLYASHMQPQQLATPGDVSASAQPTMLQLAIGIYPHGGVPGQHVVSHETSAIPAQANDQARLVYMAPTPTVAQSVVSVAPSAAPSEAAAASAPQSPEKSRPLIPRAVTKRNKKAKSSTRTSKPAGEATEAGKGVEEPQRPTSNTPLVNHPRVVATKFEDGMLKPVYDPEELQQWRAANGMKDPAPADMEKLPLLPLSTGGHDPTRTLPAHTLHAQGSMRGSHQGSLPASQRGSIHGSRQESQLAPPSHHTEPAITISPKVSEAELPSNHNPWDLANLPPPVEKPIRSARDKRQGPRTAREPRGRDTLPPRPGLLPTHPLDTTPAPKPSPKEAVESITGGW